MTSLTLLTPQQLCDINELIIATKLRGKIKKRTRQRKRDPEKIPRPLNCFLLYRMEKQKQICELCPGANHRSISKIVAKWWKEISMEDKQKYVDAAKKAKTEHKSLYPNYKYIPRRKPSFSQLENSESTDDNDMNHNQKEQNLSVSPLPCDHDHHYYKNGNEFISNDPFFSASPPPFTHYTQKEENNSFFTPMTTSTFYESTSFPTMENNNSTSLSPCPYHSSFYHQQSVFSSASLSSDFSFISTSLNIDNNNNNNNNNHHNYPKNNILQHDSSSSSSSSMDYYSNDDSIFYPNPMIHSSNDYINNLVQMIYGSNNTSYMDMLNMPLSLTQPIYDSPLMLWSDFMFDPFQPVLGGSLYYPDPGYLMFPLL